MLRIGYTLCTPSVRIPFHYDQRDAGKWLIPIKTIFVWIHQVPNCCVQKAVRRKNCCVGRPKEIGLNDQREV